jgi:manganese/iron transport system ATP-binding protein
MSLLAKLQNLNPKRRAVAHREDAPFLEVVGLSANYDGLPALEDINFVLQPGEHVAVVGPNGAGKSTLFKAIAGVLTPMTGQINLSGHAPRGHICIAYLPQRSEVDWTFPVTVQDVVMMGRVGKMGFLGWPKAKDWELVQECLSLVTMAQEAELVLMDEPLSGLDVPSQEEVFRIIEKLKERDVSVMIATHNLDMASDRFDLVMLLNHRLMGFGRPDEVFTEDHLRAAYGKHLQMVKTEDGLLILDDDTCCDD